MLRNCRWVLAGGTYCEAKVDYRMVPDGGEIGAALVRKYEPFCPVHMVRAAQKKQTENRENREKA